MGEGERFQLGTVGALTVTVVSSVSIVICSKALISSLGFNFATTLTSWHLLVTFCPLHMARRLKFIDQKPFDRQAVVGFGMLNAISIGLLNLSLGFNSVGFYQMTKLAIIPCNVLLETLFLTKRFSRSIQLSLLILLLGVGIATITDVQLNALMTKTIQKKFNVYPTSISVMSVSIGDLVNIRSLFGLVFVILSCLISVSVNFSTFLVIGKTSPVTYRVLGHLKTCLVLAFGYILLRDSFNWIALVGMVLFSYFCTLESQKKATEATLPSFQAKEGESNPLITVRNGSEVVIDGVGQKAPGWDSNKDLHA